MNRRDVIEGALFLPAMASLAGLVFAAGFVLIKAGNWALASAYALLRACGLPPAPALACAVLATALLGVAFAGATLDRRKRRRPA